MNWVDALVVILLVIVVIRSWNAGLVELVLTFAGFIAGLVIASWVVRQAVPVFSSEFVRVLVLLAVEFSAAAALAMLAKRGSDRLKFSFVHLKHNVTNASFGSLLGAAGLIFTIWLAASVLVSVSSWGIARSLNQSYIIKHLDARLPSPADTFARLEKVIDPNGFPDVFLGLEPQHTVISPKNSIKNQLILNDEASVVKIHGAGCGGVVSGSGFVVAPGLIVTNAHVLAGVKRPQVVDKSRSYWATTVEFDPQMDMAILYVKDLPDAPMNLSDKVLPNNSAGATLGFPGGGRLTARDVAVIDNITAAGRDIYNAQEIDHRIYEIQGNIELGDSGGPLLAADGSAAGVIFGKSFSQDNVGYALLIGQFKPLISAAQRTTTPVSTGACAAGLVDF